VRRQRGMQRHYSVQQSEWHPVRGKHGLPQLCQACTAAKKGSGADGTCGTIVGGDPDNECFGATMCNGMTCGLFENGAACSSGLECVSGNCVEGVCCNGVCNGLCQACVGAKTGAADGTCSGVTAGTDPDNECSDLTSSPNCAGALACGP
jgi:hypothetical protein